MTFKPGNRANPNGRPVGRPDKRSQFRALLEADAPAIIAKAIEMALAGDIDAIKTCLQLTVPKLRDEAPRRALTIEGDTVELQGRSIVAAIAAGELSPDEGAALLNGLARQSEIEKLGTLADIVCRLAADRNIPVPPELQIRQRIPQTFAPEPSNEP